MLDLESGSCRFACNGDKGLTWPEVADISSTFKCNETFDYPNIPSNNNNYGGEELFNDEPPMTA